MFILEFLPQWVFYAITLAGVVGLCISVTFSTLIPSNFQIPLDIISILLFTFGVFVLGAYSNEASWQIKVAQMETDIANRELAAEEVTNKVITKYVDNVKIVKGKTSVIIKKVPEYITKYADSKCIINTGFVELLNASSKNEVPKSTGIANETPTNIKLSGVAESVSRNYGTYYEVVEQLTSLQYWIRQQKDLDNGQ